MKYKVTLNGKTYEVEVEEGKAILLDEYEAVAPKQEVVAAPVVAQAAAPQAAAPAVQAASADAVTAPISGTILSIKAPVGTSVKSGDVVLIIEAMKMENEIVAPKAGTVSKIYVSQSAAVETGAALFDIS